MGTLRRPRAVRSHPARSSRKPRRQDRGGARARRASRPDDQPLPAPAESWRHGRRHRSQHVGRHSGPQGRVRRTQRLVGSRLRRSVGGFPGRGGRHARHHRRRAGRSASGTDGRRDQLLHAGRRTATARDRARNLGRAGRNVASRDRAPPRRSCFHVRRRARPDRSIERTCRDPTDRDARCRLAASDCRPDRRPGLQRAGSSRTLERHGRRSGCAAGAAGGAARTSPGPARVPRAARGGQLAPSTGRGGVVPTPACQRPVRSPGHQR